MSFQGWEASGPPVSPLDPRMCVGSVGQYIFGALQWFWGSGENGYLFSGIWGALVFTLGDLGSKLIVLGI